MLFLALSCLQGRPMASAARDLLELGPVGLQLTPGCVPTSGFADFLRAEDVEVRTHQGFSFDAPRGPVWDGASLCSIDNSVHPPRLSAVLEEDFFQHLESSHDYGVALETMYPGYNLGTGPHIERAMDIGVPLAVDVSHIFMQLEVGAMTPSTWHRVQEYTNITEVHLSSNDGTRDQHHAIDPTTFGFDWAIDAGRRGVAVILESYFHKQTPAQRRAQVALIVEQLPPSTGDHNGRILRPNSRTQRFPTTRHIRAWRAPAGRRGGR